MDVISTLDIDINWRNICNKLGQSYLSARLVGLAFEQIGQNDSTIETDKKIWNKIQAPNIFFLTLLFMGGNYEPTCIVTIKMATM